MMFIHSKHQKLILQCYPAGKGVDKKPNPSELSYLLYYASTRRVKLEKVANFLEKKNASDTSRNRAGNLQVTLAILSALIEKCSDDLNVFAGHICIILQSILQTEDIALCKSVLNTYGVFCVHLNNALFPGDRTFLDSFTKLSESIINIGIANSSASGPHQFEWKMISLMASRHLSNCIGHNQKYAKKFIGLSIPVYIHTIHNDCSLQALNARLKSNVNTEGGSSSVSATGHRLSKVISTKQTTEIYKHIDEDFDNDTLTSRDITEEAFRGIKSYFNTTSTTQIAEVTQAVIAYSNETTIEQTWGITFLEMCTTWIPVQLRFITLSTLLSRLEAISKKATSSSPKFELQFQYASTILGLVSSDVNLIGLSISDVIQQLLQLQSDLLLHQAAFLSNDKVQKLSLVYSNSICNLSTHIYYFDQIPDSIQEILIKVDSVLEYSFLEIDPHQNVRVSGDKIHRLIVTLLEDVSIMFDHLKKHTSTISRNHVSLEHWDISLPILAPESEFDSLPSASGTPSESPAVASIQASSTKIASSSLTISQKNDIQRKYLKVFREFLNNELTTSDSRDSSDIQNPNVFDPSKLPKSRHGSIVRKSVNFNDDQKNYALPDTNQYISLTDNFIAHFLGYVDKFFSTSDYPNIENSLLIADILKDMLTVLGINFVANFVPFFYHWMLPFGKTSNSQFSQATKFKDTIGHVVMYHCLRALDDMYPDKLEEYAQSSPYYSNLLVDIEFRKLNKFWIPGIYGEPTDEELVENARINRFSHKDDDGTLRFIASKKSFQEFVTGNVFASLWINPNRPLILDFKGGDQHIGLQPHYHSNGYSGLSSGIVSGSQSTNGTIGPSAPNGNLSTIQDYENSINDQATGNYSLRHHNTTLGLGKANDITSIHSELIHNSHRNILTSGLNGNVLGGLFLHENGSAPEPEPRYYNLPKVSDLKDSMYEHNLSNFQKPSIHINDTLTSTPGSILDKNILSSDVDAIIGGLDSDDDTAIIV